MDKFNTFSALTWRWLCLIISFCYLQYLDLLQGYSRTVQSCLKLHGLLILGGSELDNETFLLVDQKLTKSFVSNVGGRVVDKDAFYLSIS